MLWCAGMYSVNTAARKHWSKKLQHFTWTSSDSVMQHIYQWETKRAEHTEVGGKMYFVFIFKHLKRIRRKELRSSKCHLQSDKNKRFTRFTVAYKTPSVSCKWYCCNQRHRQKKKENSTYKEATAMYDEPDLKTIWQNIIKLLSGLKNTPEGLRMIQSLLNHGCCQTVRLVFTFIFPRIVALSGAGGFAQPYL